MGSNQKEASWNHFQDVHPSLFFIQLHHSSHLAKSQEHIAEQQAKDASSGLVAPGVFYMCSVCWRRADGLEGVDPSVSWVNPFCFCENILFLWPHRWWWSHPTLSRGWKNEFRLREQMDGWIVAVASSRSRSCDERVGTSCCFLPQAPGTLACFKLKEALWAQQPSHCCSL